MQANPQAAADELRQMHQSAITANKPIFAHGGIFISFVSLELFRVRYE